MAQNMQMDKITPLAAPPGHSLTQEPGRWPWEQPPRIVDPDDAVDFVTEQLDTPKTKESLMKLLVAGISIEEVVNQIAFKGFMTGTYTPDVAELIKPAVAMYLVHEADKLGFEAKMFSEEPPEEDIDDNSLFEIMKRRNPSLYMKMVEKQNEENRLQVTEEVEVKPDLSASFISVQGDEQ